MKHWISGLFIVIVMAAACGEKQQVKARVFERKEIGADRLMIKYQYMVDEKMYTDSATIKNMVIATDSIDVIIDPATPSKALPQLEK